MPQYTFTVDMTCTGCSNAVSRVLTKLEGVDKFDINLEDKKVVVDTELPRADILAVLQKTGKHAE